MTTTDLATTTTPTTPETTQPPAEVPDKGTTPRYAKGDRVVLRTGDGYRADIDGRHGTIIAVETIVMRTVTLGIGSVGPCSDERSHYYKVKTDGGFIPCTLRAEELTREEPGTTPPTVLPDPVDANGEPTTVGSLCRAIEYAHSSMVSAKARAGRARVRKSIDGHMRLADAKREEKGILLHNLDAWCVRHPEGREAHLATIETTLRRIGLLSSPKPVSAGAGGGGAVGVTMSENEERNGVELRFESKPDAETLTTLKRNGWRWAMRSRCWYARRNEDTLAFARALAGEAVAA